MGSNWVKTGAVVGRGGNMVINKITPQGRRAGGWGGADFGEVVVEKKKLGYPKKN